MGRSTRRVAICRRSSGEVTILSTVTPFRGTARGQLRVVAANITPTGYVHAREVSSAPADGEKTPIAAAISELGPFVSIEEYPACFGHVTLDKLYLLVATRVELAISLPFGREVFAIRGTKWIPVELSGVPPPRAVRKDRLRVDHFLATNFEDGYYYSDDVNVSRLFPYTSTGAGDSAAGHSNSEVAAIDCLPIDKDDACFCDWSTSMRAPYVKTGCGAVCSALIRGFAKGVEIGALTDDGTPTTVHVHMMGRQNRINPGPRYFGRGLNEVGQAGNDHVYELVAWRYDDDSSRNKIHFARHVYLRGTVPLRFVSKLSTSGIGEASIIIDSDVYDGSPEYLARQCTLLEQLRAFPGEDPQHLPTSGSATGSTPDAADDAAAAPEAAGDEGVGEDVTTPSTRLLCMNLLKSVSAAGEDKLTHHFGIAIKRANGLLRRQCGARDGCGSSTAGSEVTARSEVASLEATARSSEAADVMATAATTSNLNHESEPGAAPSTVGDAPGEVLPHRIELTNVDWLGLQKDHGTPGACSALWDAALPFLTASPFCSGTAEFDDADPSFDLRVDRSSVQRHFVRANCADSLDRTNVAMFFTIAQVFPGFIAQLGVDPQSSVPITVGNDSNLLSPRSGGKTAGGATPVVASELTTEVEGEGAAPVQAAERFERMVAGVPGPLMRALVEIFVANGDCVAQLYTATGALHTSIMRKLSPGMKEAPSNGIISAQRRFENMFKDRKKRRVLETMLGVRLPVHFPSFQGMYGLMPLPHDLWPSAVVVMGLDVSKDVKPETITVAMQHHWVDIQHREGVEFATNRLVGELPVKIGLDLSGESGAFPATASPSASPAASPATPPPAPLSPTPSTRDDGDDEAFGDGAEIGTADRSALASELMAVVVMPSADIAREIMQRGALPIRYSDGEEGFVSLHPYEYTVETRDLIATSSPVGKMVTAASSLKRKVLRLFS